MKVIIVNKNLWIFYVLTVLLSLTIFCAYQHLAYKKMLKEQPPSVREIRFETLDGDKIDDSTWVKLDKKVRIVVTVSGNCDQVDLIITETGTCTYKYQQMIDVVFPKGNIAEYIWEVPKDTRGHFWVVAYNGLVGRRTFPINVVREENEVHSGKL